MDPDEMEKAPDAFRTISEVADLLETPAHVLRFWESRFPQIKPVKRAGGRRYYRPVDVALLTGIKRLLHDEGMTIRGVQKILREQGIRHVSGLAEDRERPIFALEGLAGEHGLSDEDDGAPADEEAHPPLETAPREREEAQSALIDRLSGRMTRREDRPEAPPAAARDPQDMRPDPGLLARGLGARPRPEDRQLDLWAAPEAASAPEAPAGDEAEAPMALWAEPEAEAPTPVEALSGLRVTRIGGAPASPDWADAPAPFGDATADEVPDRVPDEVAATVWPAPAAVSQDAPAADEPVAVWPAPAGVPSDMSASREAAAVWPAPGSAGVPVAASPSLAPPVPPAPMPVEPVAPEQEPTGPTLAARLRARRAERPPAEEAEQARALAGRLFALRQRMATTPVST